MSGLDAGVEKLRADGAGDAAIASFRHYYELLEAGDEGMLAERDIEPVEDVPSVDDLPGGERRRRARPGGRAQAQRRAGHEHGHDAGQVAAGGARTA